MPEFSDYSSDAEYWEACDEARDEVTEEQDYIQWRQERSLNHWTLDES